MELYKAIMLVLDFLIIVCVFVGFFVIRKLFKAHDKNKGSEEENKKIKSTVTAVGVTIAALSFIVLAISVCVSIMH